MPVVAGDARGEPPPPGSLLDQGFALVFAGLVVVAYLPYASFEAWPYLRFLLPAFPVLLVTSAFLARRLLDHVPVPARVPLLAAAVAALCTYQGVVARQGQAFALQRLERRSVETGQWAANALPHDAVLLAVQQSGSLRHYARRPTIRWDHLEPAWLEPALAHLRGVGLVPYLVLESWEEVQFRERFSGATALGRLDWPPMAELLSTPRVRVFDPRDRAPFMAGMPLRPERISPPPPR